MRRPFALGALTIIALGGMIGFAAFSTNGVPVSTTVVDAELPSVAHGRVAAAAFAAMLQGELPTSVDATAEPAVEAEPPASETTTSTSTPTAATTTAPPIQRAAVTTSPPGTTTTTTTTAAPTTTTTTTTTTAAPPTTTTAPPIPGGPRDVEAWRSLVEQHFSNARVDEALRVIECESRGDPTAVNPVSGASGLFQFIAGTWTWASAEAGWAGADALEPEANIAVAAWLVQVSVETNHPGGPWGHWTCRP